VDAHADAGNLVALTESGSIVGVVMLFLHDDLISAERVALQVCWYVTPACCGSPCGSRVSPP